MKTPLIPEPLPLPEAEALAISEALIERIKAAIDAGGGWLSFEQYMQMALYEPGLGYYSAGAVKLGAGGDFTTAPELGDWLAGALAAFISAQFGELEAPRLLELGAGTGALAQQLLARLAERGHDGIEYSILEISGDLRERQQARLANSSYSVKWLERLPEAPFDGIVLANEVADAIPVVRFVKAGGTVLPLGVAHSSDGLIIAAGAPDAALSETVSVLEAELGAPLPDGYRSEICRQLEPWLAAVLNSIAAGGMLLIDYGLPRRDYYRPERMDGTLICHYRQRAHGDPLLWPGLQDLSAWVDFSSVAAAARAAGFSLAGFTTQAQFLLESIAADPALAARQPTAAQASALQTLVLPGEMGERFKLMWLARGESVGALPGRDFRSWL
jgi:SAM-dependent MidA family methyltransferase